MTQSSRPSWRLRSARSRQGTPSLRGCLNPMPFHRLAYYLARLAAAYAVLGCSPMRSGAHTAPITPESSPPYDHHATSASVSCRDDLPPRAAKLFERCAMQEGDPRRWPERERCDGDAWYMQEHYSYCTWTLTAGGVRISPIVDTQIAASWTPVSPDGGRSVATLGFGAGSS